MFFGREKELALLNELYNSNKAEFLTLFGRRRIGKTELLKQFAIKKEYIFYSAKECTDYEQLSSISEKILGKGMRFNSWEDLFNHIGEIAKEKKLILILDEFPYMIKGNSSIASILQNVWDHNLKDTKIKLVICGSSMSFIEKEILSEKNPLYGRMTSIYKLDELAFEEIRLFFPNYSTEDLITVYSILGGVPHYLLQFDSNLDIKTNICNNIINKGKILYNEVDFLLKQELREPLVYYTIIEKIAYGATKLNDISTKTQIPANKLSVYTKNLIELGVIIKEYPITEKIKARVSLHSGIYKLNSNFFEFYFRFVFPNLSEIEEGLIEDIYEYDIEANLNTFVSYSYEKICKVLLKKTIAQSKKPYRIKHMGRWWNKKEEIDIVGFNEQGEYVFGECKWRNQKCNTKVFEQLKEKTKDNFKYINAHYYLFSKSGFTKQLVNISKENKNLHLIESFNMGSI